MRTQSYGNVYISVSFSQDNEVTESVDLTCNNISDEGVQVLSCCCLGNNRLAALSTLKLNG